ncbi:MAG: TonB-dependent receptor, partial [Myxococcales bacterium]|nr:TonB-dependent receptor [Myxococcales bacterium]
MRAQTALGLALWLGTVGAARADEPIEAAPSDDGPTDDGTTPSPEAPPEEAWSISVLGRSRETKRVAGSAHEIDEEQLERFEDDNPEKILTRVPGVYARSEDGFGLRPNIGMRGGSADRSKKIALMEDGVLFGPAPYAAPAAYYFPLATRMHAIEVFKGPSAIRYGPNTIGGAINMVTRPIPWGHSFGADLALGTTYYGKAHGYYGYGTDHWGVLVEAVRLRSDGFKTIDGADRTGRQSGFDKLETMLKARVNTDPGGELYNELELKLGYAAERSNETYLGLTDDDFAADPLRRYAASAPDHMTWGRYQVELSHSLAFSDWLRIRTTAYRHDFDRSWWRFNAFTDGTTAREVLRNPDDFPSYLDNLRGLRGDRPFYQVDNHRRYVAQGVQSAAAITLPTIALGEHLGLEERLMTGLRVHNDSVDRVHTNYRLAIRDGQPERLDDYGLIATNNFASAVAVSGYAVDEIGLWRFLLTPGVRIEGIVTSFDDRDQGTEVDGTQLAVLPGVGVLFQATEELSLLGGVHQGFSPISPQSVNTAEQEKATNYELGGRFSTEPFQAEAIGFVSDYQNLSFTCEGSAGCDQEDVGEQTSTGRALIAGLETSATADIPTPIDLHFPLTLSYTFTHGHFAEDFIGDNSLESVAVVRKGDLLPYLPPHQFAATAAIASERWGQLAAGFTFIDRMREVAGSGEPLPGDVTDPYAVLDLSATFRATEEIAIYGKIENLLDARVITSRRPFGARPNRP